MKITAEGMEDGGFLITKIEGLTIQEIIEKYGVDTWNRYFEGTFCCVYHNKYGYGDSINFIVTNEWNKKLNKPYYKQDNVIPIGSQLSREDYLRLLKTLEECSRRLRTFAGLKTRKAIGTSKLLVVTTI